MESFELLMKWNSILFRHTQMVLAKKLEPMGVGMGQYHFLIAICRQPGVSQDQLGERLCMNKSTVARAIAQLEANGFLRREVNPADKRAYLVYPTQKAEEILPRIFALLREEGRLSTQDLTPEEELQALDLLERMAKSVLARSLPESHEQHKEKEIAP